MKCFNSFCQIRVNDSSDINNCECTACPNRAASDIVCVSDGTSLRTPAACVMPEMPYCPACKHGYIVPVEGSDTDVEWRCLLSEEDRFATAD